MTRLLRRHGPETPVCFGGAHRAAQHTASELVFHVAELVRRLPEAPRGARVLLACGDRYAFSVGLLACWVRGLVAVLPSNGQPATVHALAESTHAVALLHDRDGGQGLDVREVLSLTGSGSLPLTLATGEADTAVIAFTSGSTGEPQAHPKSLSQLLEETGTLVARFELEGARVVSAVPAHHLYGLLFGVLVPLVAGGAMSRVSPLLPRELVALVHAERADVLVAVPPHLRALADDADVSWPFMRRAFSSGAPLADAVALRLSQRGLRVTQVLGSTETGGIASRDAPDEPFRPLPRVQLHVSDDGSLSVDAPWLPADMPRPMPTQDRVELVPGGFLHLGRVDHVVKVGGRRVDLGDVEARLRALPGVRDARVLARADSGARGTELLAVVEGEGLDARALKRQLAAHLDPVTLPRRFRFVHALPRTAAGKVSQAELLALFDRFDFPREELADGQVRVLVPESSGFFRGHFDGLPVLPGVVQLQHVVLAEARRRWPDLGSVSRVTRVKFRRPISPGAALSLELSRKSDVLVEFSMRCGEHPTSSGLIHFRGAKA
jgi:4-coumarate--CoA ligase (photoactive yellow protein activation family)